MKPHTPDQVAAMKSFADSQPNGAERKTYALNGLEVTYTTIDMGDAKPFDYAVAAFVTPREHGEPTTETDYEIAVSDDVPEELQGIWAWHELHDFAVLGHEAENRCLQSEQLLAESMSSDPELYQRYVAARIPFYDGLAVLIATDLDQKGGDSVYSPSDLQGCYDAITFLNAAEQRFQAYVDSQADQLALLQLERERRDRDTRNITGDEGSVTYPNFTREDKDPVQENPLPDATSDTQPTSSEEAVPKASGNEKVQNSPETPREKSLAYIKELMLLMKDNPAGTEELYDGYPVLSASARQKYGDYLLTKRRIGRGLSLRDTLVPYRVDKEAYGGQTGYALSDEGDLYIKLPHEAYPPRTAYSRTDSNITYVIRYPNDKSGEVKRAIAQYLSSQEAVDTLASWVERLSKKPEA